MQDSFKDRIQGLSSPAAAASPILPSDGADLRHMTRAIYIGAAGDLRVEMASGEQVTFRGLVAGNVYPFRLRRVLASGTTAGDLLALW